MRNELIFGRKKIENQKLFVPAVYSLLVFHTYLQSKGFYHVFCQYFAFSTSKKLLVYERDDLIIVTIGSQSRTILLLRTCYIQMILTITPTNIICLFYIIQSSLDNSHLKRDKYECQFT